jgi:hypothetical protein
MSKSKKEDKEITSVLLDISNLDIAKIISDPNRTVEIVSPIKKAFSIERGTGGWITVEYHLRNDEVIEVIRTEPDIKAAAINNFKKAAFHWWQSIG